MNFRVFDTSDAVVRGLADLVVDAAEKSERCVISLSGGSTPASLYSHLGEGDCARRLEGRTVIWVTGDERCVAPDHESSNSRMIEETLFRGGISEHHTFLRFRTEIGDPAEIASAFEDEWQALGIDRIDIALLGVGEDGHTASIFPGTDIIGEKDRIASEVWVERIAAWRVSLTTVTLKLADTRVVLAIGSSKRDILSRIREGVRFPVAEVMSDGRAAWWFVDLEAYPGDSS